MITLPQGTDLAIYQCPVLSRSDPCWLVGDIRQPVGRDRWPQITLPYLYFPVIQNYIANNPLLQLLVSNIVLAIAL